MEQKQNVYEDFDSRMSEIRFNLDPYESNSEVATIETHRSDVASDNWTDEGGRIDTFVLHYNSQSELRVANGIIGAYEWSGDARYLSVPLSYTLDQLFRLWDESFYEIISTQIEGDYDKPVVIARLPESDESKISTYYTGTISRDTIYGPDAEVIPQSAQDQLRIGDQLEDQPLIYFNITDDTVETTPYIIQTYTESLLQSVLSSFGYPKELSSLIVNYEPSVEVNYPETNEYLTVE